MLKRILAGTLTVAEAAQLAEVTPMTVRRRLRELAKKSDWMKRSPRSKGCSGYELVARNYA